jgi:hypothetical protein
MCALHGGKCNTDSRCASQEPALHVPEFILKDDMSKFLPVDEQMDLIENGAATIVPLSNP